MERECLDCGNTLRGRADKKFCDDQCRSNYNNQIKAGFATVQRPVNAILRKNHNILTKLCKGSKIRLKKDDLLRYGFDLTYHTHLYNTQNGNIYYFCYDYGYMRLDSEMYLVVRRNDKL
jgi:hypothetical protein